MGQYTKAVQQLYVAYFNRPADPGGLAYWEGVVGALAGDVSPISAAFSKSPEYVSAYAGKTNAQIVNQVYLNLFGRPAEAGGSAYWTDLLNRKLITIDNVVAQVARGAQGTDLVAYDSKVGAASAFTTGLNSPEKADGYNADTIALAKSFISGITDVASLNAAVESAALQSSINFMRATFDGLHNPAADITLSSDTDTISGTDNQSLKGNDIFRGSDQSWSAADKINAGSGIDTLLIDSTQTGTYTLPAAGNSSNFEIISVKTPAQFVGDVSGILGLSQFSLTSLGDTSVTAAASTKISVTEVLGAGALSVNGGTDINITATGATTGTISVGSNTAPTGNVKVSRHFSDLITAGTITIHGGRSIEVVQTHSGENIGVDLDARFGIVNVFGTTNTTSVKIDNSNFTAPLNFAYGNKVTITDIHHDSTTTGTIKNVDIRHVRGLDLNVNSLSTINLTSAGGDIKFNNTGTTLTTLDLNLRDNYSTFSESANALKTINIHNIGDSRFYTLDAKNVETLNIDGTGRLGISMVSFFDGFSKLDSLRQINVSDAVAFSADVSNLQVLNFDVSKSTGGSFPGSLYASTINGLITNYLGGSGADSVTALNGISKKITLGAGNDLLTATSISQISNTAQIDGGSGTDILWLDRQSTTAFSANGINQVTGFETLYLHDPYVNFYQAQSWDLANFSGQTEVALSGSNGVTLTNWNQSASLGLLQAGKSYTIENPSFATGSNDTLSILLHSQQAQVYASEGIRADGVENIRIARGDKPGYIGNYEEYDNTSNNPVAQLTLLGNDLKTITLTGKSTQYELSAASSALNSLDASAVAGGALKFTAGSLTAAISVKGVANGNNTLNLSAATKGITYTGGAGADDITLGSGNNIISVGKGADVVTLLVPGSSAGSFTTIKDLHAGMTLAIDGHASTSFNRTMVSLSSNASFQDYLNAVVHQSNDSASEGVFGWFQYKGDSYLVESRHSASGSAANFVDGTDLIVKLTGIHNLASASFNSEGTFVF